MAVPKLTPEQVAKLRRVCENCESLRSGTILPGLAAGLPMEAAKDIVDAQQKKAESILRGYGHTTPDSGVG